MLINVFKDGLDFYKSIFAGKANLSNQTLEDSHKHQKLGAVAKFRLVWIISCIGAAVALVGQVINMYVQAGVGISGDSNTLVTTLGEMDPGSAFLLVVVLGPLIEEVAFRLWISQDKASIIGGLYLFAYYLGIFLSGLLIRAFGENEASVIAGFGVFVALFLLVSLLIRIKEEALKNFVNNHLRAIVVTTILTFAIIHFLNFDLGLVYLPLVLILTLPQLTAGFVFTYVRLRLGFVAAFLSHAMQNLILGVAFFTLTPFLSLDQTRDILNDLNRGYLLKVFELLFEVDEIGFQLSVAALITLYLLVLTTIITYFTKLYLQSRKKSFRA
jgi:membrane protease YdiL (CAAX protease family)